LKGLFYSINESYHSAYVRFQKYGVNNINTVKSSNLPASIKNPHHHFAKSGKLLKLLTGFKLPKAGPTLPNEDAAPPIAVSKSKPKKPKTRAPITTATHNTWGLICGDGPIKNDDGEAGAGMVILRMLEREGLHDHLVVVTRWFGGKHLGGDRFRHVQEAVRIYLEARASRA